MTPTSRVSAPPTAEERQSALAAAAAMRGAIADPATMGRASVTHVDYARPRRAEWITTWPGLPGFTRISGSDGLRYTHVLLPGWEYRRSEIVAEMIPDLEALAWLGERPSVATQEGPALTRRPQFAAVRKAVRDPVRPRS